VAKGKSMTEEQISLLPPICSADFLCIIADEHVKHKHKRGCPCPSCRGRRNRRSGKRAQAGAYRQAGGVEAFRDAVTNEETWSAFDWAPGVRWEAKSGSSIPKWLTNAIEQVRSAHGDSIRPALIIKPKGTSVFWVVIKLEDLEAECRELASAAPGTLTDERIEFMQAKIHAMRAILDSTEKALCRRSC
jgi:hypothetical protein